MSSVRGRMLAKALRKINDSGDLSKTASRKIGVASKKIGEKKPKKVKKIEINKKCVLNMDPSQVYDYQGLLAEAYCPSCNSQLCWTITQVGGEDDKFCKAFCCGMVYFMVAEKVRVIAIPAATLRNDPFTNQADLADAEFLNELRNI